MHDDRSGSSIFQPFEGVEVFAEGGGGTDDKGRSQR
jgi:hypothetical protein